MFHCVYRLALGVSGRSEHFPRMFHVSYRAEVLSRRSGTRRIVPDRLQVQMIGCLRPDMNLQLACHMIEGAVRPREQGASGWLTYGLGQPRWGSRENYENPYFLNENLKTIPCIFHGG